MGVPRPSNSSCAASTSSSRLRASWNRAWLRRMLARLNCRCSRCRRKALSSAVRLHVQQIRPVRRDPAAELLALSQVAAQPQIANPVDQQLPDRLVRHSQRRRRPPGAARASGTAARSSGRRPHHAAGTRPAPGALVPGVSQLLVGHPVPDHRLQQPVHLDCPLWHVELEQRQPVDLLDQGAAASAARRPSGRYGASAAAISSL